MRVATKSVEKTVMRVVVAFSDDDDDDDDDAFLVRVFMCLLFLRFFFSLLCFFLVNEKKKKTDFSNFFLFWPIKFQFQCCEKPSQTSHNFLSRIHARALIRSREDHPR